MAALDVDGAMQNVKTMLSSLTAWQSICGVSTTAEAATRIYEGGTEDDLGESDLAPLIVLTFDPFQTDWMGTSKGQLTVELRTEIPIPEEHRETYADRYRYAWQKFSAIAAGINGAVNGSGQLMLRQFNVVQSPGEFDPKETNGRVEWGWITSVVLDLI